MKRLGYLLITVAFLAGALTAVLDEHNVRWDFFLAALLIGTAGLIMVHLATHRSRHSEDKLTSKMQNVNTSLTRIVDNIAALNTEKNSIHPYDMRHRIDDLFNEDLEIFVEARQSIAHMHGLHVYADVMNYFATGERYLNRVWSASVDGYIDEINTYLGYSHSQFAEALQKLRQLAK